MHVDDDDVAADHEDLDEGHSIMGHGDEEGYPDVPSRNVVYTDVAHDDDDDDGQLR